MLETKGWCQHPYCLSLDLYNTTWCNLLSQGMVIAHSESTNIYQTDKAKLAYLIGKLCELPLRHPLGTYVDAIPIILMPSVNTQAKL